MYGLAAPWPTLRDHLVAQRHLWDDRVHSDDALKSYDRHFPTSSLSITLFFEVDELRQTFLTLYCAREASGEKPTRKIE